MMLLRVLFVLLAFNGTERPLYASTNILIFGGGPKPNESQVSIELNTLWIENIVRRHQPEGALQMLYTDGNAPGVDVRSLSDGLNESDAFHPLARVYNVEFANDYVYHSSNIPGNAGPSNADNVRQTINRLLEKGRPQDDFFFIYQGHGGYNKDTNKNHLRLWDETSLTVTQLESILAKADSGVTIRFLLPQCFSGAFTRLVYKNATVKNGLAEGLRCGFLAQREDSESEGCTDSVNTDDYRDYSSYFFSAIDGKARDGGDLLQNPDRNSDGVVTLLEAHYYALANAVSVDYSRSTSQDYLEQWQPWYLRWLAIPLEPVNIYSEIAAYIGNRFQLQGQGSSFIAEVSKRLESLDSEIIVLKEEQKRLLENVKKDTKYVQKHLEIRWPAIHFPYTAGFRKILLDVVKEVQQVILEEGRYTDIVTGQNRLQELKTELLELQREMVQMKKILWIRKLARILAQFERYATDKEKAEYQMLVQCEDAPL